MPEVMELRTVVSLSAVSLCSAVVVAAFAASPVQPPPEVTHPPAVVVPELDPLPFPVADIHPGLRGVARTVFEGNRLEDFEVEFLGVLKNAIGPQQDMILARLHGEKVEFTGVVAGMSGSPVYVDGRIVGAISYRLGAFAKEPIAGITPIADMMRAGAASIRPRIASNEGGILGWLERGSADRAAASAPGVAGSDAIPAGAFGNFVPIATPLVCAGCDPGVLDHYAPAFQAFGMHPSSGGGGGSDPNAPPDPSPLKPGEAIGAELASGDLSLAAIGTLTHVDGNKVYAFGHPMAGLGPIDVPMTRADVVVTLASTLGSFKLANTTTPVGAITEDRLTAIVGEVGRKAAVLPMKVRVTSAGGEREFKYDVVRDRTWTPVIAAMTTANSLVRSTEFDAAATVALKSRIVLDGHPEVIYEDLYSGTSPSQPVHIQAANDVGSLIGLLCNNPFEEAVVRSAETQIEILPPSQVATLTSVHTAKGEVRAGEPFKVSAVLSPFRGRDRVVSFDVTLPEDTPPGDVQIFVGGGSAMDNLDRRVIERQASQAKDLDDLLRLVGRQRKSHTLFLRVLRRAPSAIVRSDLLPELPLSVFSVFNNPRLSADSSVMMEAPILEVGRDLDLVATGGRRISVKVK